MRERERCRGRGRERERERERERVRETDDRETNEVTAQYDLEFAPGSTAAVCYSTPFSDTMPDSCDMDLEFDLRLSPQ